MAQGSEIKKHGKYVEYHTDNLFPQFMYEYFDGMKTGVWTLFYNNNKIHIQCSYKNDILDGEYVEYDLKGSVVKRGKFCNGLRTGLWIEGTEIGEYVNDVRHGPWIRSRFNILRKNNYNNGLIVSVGTTAIFT